MVMKLAKRSFKLMLKVIINSISIVKLKNIINAGLKGKKWINIVTFTGFSPKNKVKKLEINFWVNRNVYVVELLTNLGYYQQLILQSKNN